MPRNILHICVAARLALCDLEEIDKRLSGDWSLDGEWLLLVKQSLIAVTNIVDLEPSIRHLYKARPVLSLEFKNQEKALAFAKYIRNIMVGHINDDLIAKAIEWKPELLKLLLDNDDKARILINVFILETALNTYVDHNGKHRIFGGDTDLIYPPDWNRFLDFLERIVRGGITFLKLVVAAAQEEMSSAPEGKAEILGYLNAGQTSFARIKK